MATHPTAKRLKIISDRMGNDPNDFQFMAHFSDFAKAKYLSQAEADNKSLSLGLRLLENAIQTIEGIIEIERAKSDSLRDSYARAYFKSYHRSRRCGNRH